MLKKKEQVKRLHLSKVLRTGKEFTLLNVSHYKLPVQGSSLLVHLILGALLQSAHAIDLQ